MTHPQPLTWLYRKLGRRYPAVFIAVDLATAFVVGTGVTYKWGKKKFDLQANYDLRYMGIDFGPPLMSSTRGHMGNNITRVDFFHMVTFGVVRPF